MVDPFDPELVDGGNSYASKPSGRGVGLYFALWVDLESLLNPETGFVVNVSEIDKLIRSRVVPIFSERIQQLFALRKTPMISDLVSLLKKCWIMVQEGFSGLQLKRLQLELNPFRQIVIHSEDTDMIKFCEKFEFAAMHRLWNDTFDDAANFEAFGKCANPAGHGHNYILEVLVQSSVKDISPGWLSDYQRVVKENFVDLVDHKNLNMDVPELEKINPTVENLARFAWEKLADKFNQCTLCSIKIWENDRTYCVYCE